MNLAVQLEDYLNHWRSKRFSWTFVNCAHFAQGWVQRVEPGLVTPRVFPQGLKSVLRMIEEVGTMRNGVDRALGRTAMPASFAMVGDLMLMHTDLNGALGICNGTTVACITEQGVGFTSLHSALCAWPIGRGCA